jgi:hypothetical protein
MQTQRVLHHGDRFPVPLPAGKNHETLRTEEIRFPIVQIIYILPGGIVEDAQESRPFREFPDAAMLDAVTLDIAQQVPEHTIKIKQQNNSPGDKQGNFQALDDNLTYQYKSFKHRNPSIFVLQKYAQRSGCARKFLHNVLHLKRQ